MAIILATTALIADISAAIDSVDGLPRRSAVIGGPDALPLEWSPGAPGWTERLLLDPVDAGDGYATLAVTEYAERHMGKTVGDVVIPAFGAQKSILLAGQSNAVNCVPPPLGAYATAVIKCARGSMSIVEFRPGGSMRDALFDVVRGTDVQEVWWIQGEEDANSEVRANAYEANLTAFLADVRATLGKPALPARIAIVNSGLPRPYVTEIRAAQLAVCESDAFAEAFDMDAYELGPDSTHYPSETNAQIGSDLGDLFTATL